MNQILLQETEKVLNNAIASVEIEGYKLSDDEKELCMEVLNGKLTKEDYIKKKQQRSTEKSLNNQAYYLCKKN